MPPYSLMVGYLLMNNGFCKTKHKLPVQSVMMKDVNLFVIFTSKVGTETIISAEEPEIWNSFTDKNRQISFQMSFNANMRRL